MPKLDTPAAKPAEAGECRLEHKYRRRVVELIADVPSITNPPDLLPNDKLLAKLIRRRRSRVLEFVSRRGRGGARAGAVSAATCDREEEGEQIGAVVKLATDSSTNNNIRSVDSPWELYRSIKVLLLGCLLAGAPGYTAAKLFVLNDEWHQSLNPDGAGNAEKLGEHARQCADTSAS